VTIFLIRHGSAGRRNDDDPSDDERHLDSAGRLQATTITDLLGPEAITALMSSPAARCTETVGPLAARLGLPIERHSHLFEGTPIDRSWAIIERFATKGVTAAVCSHGDVIPELVRRAQLRGMSVPGKAGCSKGSIWTLHWAGDHFDRGSYTQVPKK